MRNKNVLILFLSNFHYDSRASNLYRSFTGRGYRVNVVSFDWLTPGFLPESGDISVYKLHKGFLSFTFYLKFFFILTARLVRSDADIIFAEDVYTLPLAVLFGKLKRSRVVYDSRELYGHLAGLRKRRIVQAILRLAEKIFIKGAFKIVTTGKMDSEFIEKEYGLDETIVVRNLPFTPENLNPVDYRKKYGISDKDKILLYQGVILHGRGLRILYDALEKTDNCVLVVLGDGEYREYYENLAHEKRLGDRIFFAGKIEQSRLLDYTAGADIGTAIIENLSLSYYYALPNKMFEYIQAGIPVIASNFPQMKEILDRYAVGLSVDPAETGEVIDAIRKLIDNPSLVSEIRKNCLIAAKELNWNSEIGKLLDCIK